MDRKAKPCAAAKNGKCSKHCACCGVGFQSDICSQCAVAGCEANRKNDPCRLTTNMRAAMQLTPFQMAQRIEELEKQNASLLTEGQRLARIVTEMEARKNAA